MSLEDSVKEVFKDVLDIGADEIQADDKLENGLGIDSTEMVELTVAIKKKFNLEIENNALSKGQTFNEIIETLKAQGAG